MTEQEYKISLKSLNEKHEKDKRELAIKCANENNPYKIDDIFTDHIGSVKIEKIKYSFSSSVIPSCFYYGIELKKDGTPVKKMTKRDAYQCNEIKSATI